MAIIPAHNEEDGIEKTIRSLLRQEPAPSVVLVMADNCTDETIPRAPAAGAEVIETVGNTAKKAGALNQGLARVLPLLSDDDFVLAMDADGELTGDFIPVALQIFRDVPDLGGLAGSVTARSADNVLDCSRPSSTPAARVWPAAKAGRCTCCRERPPRSRRACCATSSGPAATNCPVGAYLLSTDGVRAGLTGWGFFLAAIALPMAQIRLGEETSFQKHLAFTALLLSYPAAVALHRWSQQRWRYGPVGAVLVLLFVTGVARSDALFTSWVDARPVVSWAASSGAAGRYLSSSADVLSYHTGDRADITWDSTFGFYSNGEAAIEQAVADGTFAAIVLPSGPSGDPAQDAGQAVLQRALASSERYEALTVPGNQAGTWLVYARR